MRRAIEEGAPSLRYKCGAPIRPSFPVAHAFGRVKSPGSGNQASLSTLTPIAPAMDVSVVSRLWQSR